MASQVNPVEKLLGRPLPPEGGEVTLQNVRYIMAGDILRQAQLVKPVQQDMADFYDLHWKLPGAYDNEASDTFQFDLFQVMFPGFENIVQREVAKDANVLDVGCGSGVAGRAFFGKVFDRINYVGVDMSSAIEQAREDYKRLQLNVGLLQAELNTLPFLPGTFDFVFCPGVLHYTIDMKEAISSLAKMLKPGGRFVSWIYKRQKPIRHLTDEYIRSVISAMEPEEGFEAVKPLTKLGIALGQIKEEIDIPEDIPFLDIKKGKYNLQRFFYYHIMKLFYNPELPFQRHVVNNWNAYYPKHVLFLPAAEIRSFFEDLGFRFEIWNEEGNGVALIAVKR
jgi:ubiquinone/menaquinone biosynthesis C-methylase UbiE